MQDSKDLKQDELLSLMEDMQKQQEKQLAQLKTQQEATCKAHETASILSSENLRLKNELQKKSDQIVTLNGKLKDQSQIEAERKKSEEAKKAGEKAELEAARIRALIEGREAELDEREVEIRRKEGELETEIEKEAENRIADARHDLEDEFKLKEEHIWHMSRLREQATADKYKKLTIRYQVEFTIILFYGVIVTALQAIATPKIMEGAIQFTAYWFQALVNFDVSVIGFGHKVANISNLIPNSTASGIVFWVLMVLIAGLVIGIVYLTIYSVIILYVRYLKANQFDRYTVIAAITTLAFTIFLANVIKGIAPINLFALQIGLFLIYSGVRAWEDSIIALEHCNIYDSKLAGLHELRAFAAAGVFDKAKAVITGPMDDDSRETILKVICKEVNRPDMVILENVDYIHRTPMTVLPVGALMEIDCDAPRIEILESGVVS